MLPVSFSLMKYTIITYVLFCVTMNAQNKLDSLYVALKDVRSQDSLLNVELALADQYFHYNQDSFDHYMKRAAGNIDTTVCNDALCQFLYLKANAEIEMHSRLEEAISQSRKALICAEELGNYKRIGKL